MFGKYKISFNCDKKICKRIDELSNYYFCSRTSIINRALEEHFIRHDKKIEKKEEIKGIEPYIVKKIDKCKVSFNCSKQTSQRIDEFSNYCICLKTDIIIKSLEEYFIKHDRKLKKKENLERIKKSKIDEFDK